MGNSTDNAAPKTIVEWRDWVSRQKQAHKENKGHPARKWRSRTMKILSNSHCSLITPISFHVSGRIQTILTTLIFHSHFSWTNITLRIFLLGWLNVSSFYFFFFFFFYVYLFFVFYFFWMSHHFTNFTKCTLSIYV